VSEHCYVCGKTIESKKPLDSASNIFRVVCPRCGTYDVSHKFIATTKRDVVMNAEQRWALGHAIRRATDAHERFGEVLLDIDTVNDLIARYPLPDPVDQADLLIDSIARRSSFGRPTPPEAPEVWLARIGVIAQADLQAMQEELVAFIKPRADDGRVSLAFQLTLDGWKRAREIRGDRGPGNQAFVAMWFHEDMRGVFDEGFARALQATGYAPYRVDLAAHEGKVDDEIVAQIRRSKLVVVDATGNRPNAYFEAGFAMGLGVPVIWTCNESWDACLHPVAPNSGAPLPHEVRRWTDALAFDTRQQPFVFWSDAADLAKKLTARIGARGLALPVTRQQ
jgi:hypothetical protein